MCNSCQKGFNGKNGNGYQPCGCDTEEDFFDTPAAWDDFNTNDHSGFWLVLFIIFIFCAGVFTGYLL